MVQSSPTPQTPQTDEAKAEEQRRVEREAAERQEAERRRAEQQRGADQRTTDHRNPPRDDGKNVMERGQERAVGEAAKPEPSQAELDEHKEQVMSGGAAPQPKDRSMQAGPGRTYPTR